MSRVPRAAARSPKQATRCVFFHPPTGERSADGGGGGREEKRAVASARETCRSHGARTPGPLRRAPLHGTGNTMRAHGLPPTGKRYPDGEGGGEQEQQRSACGGRQPPWQSRGERSVRRRPLFGESRKSAGQYKIIPARIRCQLVLPASLVKINAVQSVQIRRMLYKNYGIRVNSCTILYKYGR